MLPVAIPLFSLPWNAPKDIPHTSAISPGRGCRTGRGGNNLVDIFEDFLTEFFLDSAWTVRWLEAFHCTFTEEKSE